jgi:serine/threonine protein kinase
VVEVYEVGCEPDGRTWMLMEFLDGPTLATLLARHGALSPLFALRVAIDVAWGLDAAHENQMGVDLWRRRKSVYFRDIAPLTPSLGPRPYHVRIGRRLPCPTDPPPSDPLFRANSAARTVCTADGQGRMRSPLGTSRGVTELGWGQIRRTDAQIRTQR